MRKKQKLWVLFIVILLIANIYLYMNIRNNSLGETQESSFEDSLKNLERAYFWIIGFIIVITIIALMFLHTRKRHFH